MEIFLRISYTYLAMKKTEYTAITKDNLKEITAKIIDSYKQKNFIYLRGLANELGLANCEIPQRKLFLQLVHIFHPDRYQWHLQQMALEHSGPDIAAPGFYQKINDLCHKGRKFSMAISPASEREEYGVNLHEYGIDFEEAVQDLDETDDTFLFAFRMQYIGNNDFYPGPVELRNLEGALELPSWGIRDLEGLEYCQNIEYLDLSGNLIDNLYEISGLWHLKELFLSNNQIDELTSLADLHKLEVLDLAENYIDDLSPLTALPHLKYLDIRDNPLFDKSILNKLKQSGVLVIN